MIQKEKELVNKQPVVKRKRFFRDNKPVGAWFSNQELAVIDKWVLATQPRRLTPNRSVFLRQAVVHYVQFLEQSVGKKNGQAQT